jgi:uncharacterized membrane protein (UPF0127 family)
MEGSHPFQKKWDKENSYEEKDSEENEGLGMKVEYADTFWKKFRGLMFRKKLDHAFVFLLSRETRTDACIHSFFVSFPFDAVFLDSKKRVVDFATIKPWRFYMPKKPAKYIVELPEGTIKKTKIKIGRKLPFAVYC